MNSKAHTCCFFGHRKINITDDLICYLEKVIENLITEKKVSTFLFGSKSEFDDICNKVVTTLKEKHPHIKRIYVRAEFPYIGEDYRAYLLKSYDETYFSEKIISAGKAAYIERNCEMIENSRFCVVYYNKNYMPPRSKNSGTKLAFDYANKKGLEIINIYENILKLLE